MKVLVIGSGGREHALAWKLKQSSKVTELYSAPGNAGIADIAECVPIPADNIRELFEFVKKKRVDLTVVGPEAPLVKGIVDQFEKDGLRIFGPSKLAAELEGSKVYAKHFMEKNGIPTARFRAFRRSEYEDAKAYIRSSEGPLVVKADGLAAGKGAVVCQTAGEALSAVGDSFEKNVFGDAGSSVVVEERMEGEEASVFVISDGTNYALLPPAQDHKRIFDGDKGKNTGGMGAYAPAWAVTPTMLRRIEKEIVQPTLKGMAEEGRPYKGCLYVGLMLTQDGPNVVEFNCRFGDPEAQVVLPLVDGDFFDILYAATTGNMGSVQLKFHEAFAVCVVMASRGYPDEYETGKLIAGLGNARQEDGVVVFHAATKTENGRLLTSGGRVLGVTAIQFGGELQGAIDTAYRTVKQISFDGAYYRSDIGRKGVADR